MPVMISNGLLRQFIDQFHLPEGTRKVNIKMELNDVVNVEVEYLPDIDQGGISTLCKNFILVEKNTDVESC